MFAVARELLLLLFLQLLALCPPPALCQARISQRTAALLFLPSSSHLSTPGEVGTEQRFLSGLLRDSGVMEFGSILRTLRAAGVERDVGSCPAMEEAVRLDRPICED